MKGTGYEVSYPLAVIGSKWPTEVKLHVEVFDTERWEKMSDKEKGIHYDTAAKYGRVELHRRFPLATITRME